MWAPLLYFLSIALFGFVILAAVQLADGFWLVMSIFPVFIAFILGFVMWVYAWSEFDWPVSIGSLVTPVIAAVAVRRMPTIHLFIAACVAVVIGLIFARLAFLAAGIG